jgi:hypothetical protein
VWQKIALSFGPLLGQHSSSTRGCNNFIPIKDKTQYPESATLLSFVTTPMPQHYLLKLEYHISEIL